MDKLDLLQSHLEQAISISEEFKNNTIILKIPLDIFRDQFDGCFTIVQDTLKVLASRNGLDMKATNNETSGRNLKDEYVRVEFTYDKESETYKRKQMPISEESNRNVTKENRRIEIRES